MVGPRHRGYVPRRVTRGDVAEVQALLKDASSYTKKVRREIRDLRAFMELNQFARGTPHTKVLALFAVQYLDGERRTWLYKYLISNISEINISRTFPEVG
jgi:hypothetical protein